jgi:hypothetical protein
MRWHRNLLKRRHCGCRQIIRPGHNLDHRFMA